MALITVEEEEEEAGYDIWREMSGVSLMAFSFGVASFVRRGKITRSIGESLLCRGMYFPYLVCVTYKVGGPI